jgi:hypothetical protein
MPETPEYLRIIIVAVKIRNEWQWYISERRYWILDLEHYQKDLRKYGGQGDIVSQRFGIGIVDQDSADTFLEHMSHFKVSTQYLRDVVAKASILSLDDAWEFFPSLLVDFENNEVWSNYPEASEFEYYVPDTDWPYWKGFDRPFWDKIPDDHQYWIIEGENYFKQYGIE